MMTRTPHASGACAQGLDRGPEPTPRLGPIKGPGSALAVPTRDGPAGSGSSCFQPVEAVSSYCTAVDSGLTLIPMAEVDTKRTVPYTIPRPAGGPLSHRWGGPLFHRCLHQVLGNRDKRCWSLLRRRKAFFLRLGQGKKQEVLYVDSGGWCLEKHCHAARLVKAPRPPGLIL